MTERTNEDGWTVKRKGYPRVGAKIHTHPDAFEGRAIVENHWGISFNGKMYQSLSAAKLAALQVPA